MDQVDGHITNAQDILIELGAVYHDQHPEIYDVFQVTVTGLEHIKTVVNQQRDAI